MSKRVIRTTRSQNSKYKEYKMMKYEILRKKQLQHSLSISSAICVVFVFILAYAYTVIGDDMRLLPWLCLLPHLFILPFSYKYFSYRDSILKASAYMIVFLEDEDGFQWETSKQLYDSTFLKPTSKKNIVGFVYTGISFAFLIATLIGMYRGYLDFEFGLKMCIALGVLFLMILIYVLQDQITMFFHNSEFMILSLGCYFFSIPLNMMFPNDFQLNLLFCLIFFLFEVLISVPNFDVSKRRRFYQRQWKLLKK